MNSPKNQINFPPEESELKEANLKVGDVALMMTKTLLKPSDYTYAGVISADGVISKSVVLIPKDSQHGANVQTRSCLFRIENARKVDGGSNYSDSELMMAIGKSLTYGERIQLRHWHSKGFLAVNTHNIALEAGCLEIYISDAGNEDSWFEILPVNKLRKAGEVIKYSDSLYLKCSYEKSAYYLHFNEMSLADIESKTEVNACGNSSSWRLKKYMGFDLSVTSSAFAMTGDSFRIFHKVSEGYLSVGETQFIVDLDFQEAVPDPKVFVQKGNKSSNSLWELQRVSTFVGGIALWNERFRIKHLATGLFLMKLENSLVLTSKCVDEKTEFELVPQSLTSENQIRFGVILSIRNGREVLKVDYQEEMASLIRQRMKEEYQLSFVKSKKDYSTVAFVLEDVPEMNTAHVYKLSLMIPMLIDAYKYLKHSELTQKVLQDNPEKESMLKQTSEHLVIMLKNVRKYVIHSNASEVDIIKRQSSMREMGVIDALIKLADMIQYKVQSSVMAPMLERDVSKFSYKSGSNEELNIATRFLEPLEDDIYKLLYDSVKNNPKNCKSLIDYEDRIVPMLKVKNNQSIGKILREMFKYVIELSRYSERRIDKWFEYLQQLKFSNSDINVYRMYLSMMKYLCQVDGVASPTYQALFKDKIFLNDRSTKIIKFHIVNERPCIEFDYNRKEESLKDILRFNSFLATIELVSLNDLLDLNSDLAVFYLEDLCKDKSYSKYITSAVDLFSSICLGRYTPSIESVKKLLYATPEYIILVLSSNVSNKVKGTFIEFLIHVFINVDPYVPISRFKSRCFTWPELQDQILERAEKPLKRETPNYFNEICKIVSDFWNNGNIQNVVKIEGLGKTIKITTAYLRLTNVLLDLEMLQVSFIESFQENLLYLIMSGFEKTEHWCNVLVRSVRQSLLTEYNHSLETKFSEMLEVVMDVLGTMIIQRENLHVEDLCRMFCTQITQEAINSEVQRNSSRLMEVRFQSILSKLEWKNTLDDKVYHLDISLLNLLFNFDRNVNKEVRKKALVMILADLNLRNTLKNELRSVEFLLSSAENDMFLKVLSKSKNLYALVKTLLNLQAEKQGSSTYAEYLKEASVTALEIMQLEKSETSITPLKFQSILRHSNILEPLIKVLNLKTDSNKLLYRNAISLLFTFVVDNPINQELLTPYVDILLEKIEIGLGVTKVLAQILSRNNKLRKGNRVIKLISESIDQHSYEYHLLQLLRTFVYDDNHHIIPKMQIDILKWIFNNRTVKHMHLQHSNHYDYLDPKLPKPTEQVLFKYAVKFHSEVMKTIHICTQRNRFGIMQGRKLITANNLIKTLKKGEINKMFKKTYMRFLYEVYMTYIPGSVEAIIDINSLEDIFNEVILKDLDAALESVDALVEIAKKGVYENIICKKKTDIKIAAFMKVVVASNPADFNDESVIEQRRISKKVKLSEAEQDVLNHWNHLSGGQAWHSPKDGLLHVLRDIFLLGTVLDGDMAELVSECKAKLKTLSKRIEELEKKNQGLDFSNLIIIINSCRESIVTGCGDDEEVAKEDEQVSDKVISLVHSLRETIIDKRMSLEEIFSIFDSDKNGSISKIEFKNGIKCILNVNNFDLEGCFAYFSDASGILRLSNFSTIMRKYFYKPLDQKRIDKVRISKFLRPGTQAITSDVIQKFKTFTERFESLCKDQDINELVGKIRVSFVDPAIKKNENSILKEFVSKLGTAFKKKVHKIYLLQILKLLIPTDLVLSEVFDDTNEQETVKLEEIRRTQEILSKSGVIELALTIISSEHELELVDEAVQLLISLLRYGNINVQERFLEVLKLSDNSYLFSYIRLRLRQSRDRIVDRAKSTYGEDPAKALQGKVPKAELEQNQVFQECAIDPLSYDAKAKHVESLLLLLQLCCENCYSDFQHYIRSQDSFTLGKKAISINMVNEIAQYLINIKEVGPELMNNGEALLIIPQCYKTLINLCRGPCVENQLLLGLRRKLYKFVDNIINEIYKFVDNVLDEKNFGAKLFKYSVGFLKVLLEGDSNKDIAMTMIEEINFEKLSKEAFEIYAETIHTNRDLIMKDSVGKVDEGSSWLPWKVNLPVLSIADWNLICSGFDIVIIFLKLRNKFPESAKLKSLSFQGDDEKGKSLIDRISELGGRQESLWQGIRLYIAKKFKEPEQVSMNTAYEFYLSLLASVEIERDGYLEQSYFRVPSMIAFLSNDMRDKLIFELNRNSHEEKIKSIFQRSELCQIHMHHLQQYSRFKTLTWWSSKSKSLGNINFFLIVLINLILLFSISSPNDQNFNIGEFPSEYFLTIFGVIEIIISIVVYLLYIIENYPIILYQRFNRQDDSEVYRKAIANKLRGTVLVKYYAESSSLQNHSTRYIGVLKAIYILFDQWNVYNLIYIIMVCIAWVTVYVYPFLLLDIVRRNENLRYILKAVTQNRRQLALTVLLGLIIVYLFGVIGFLSFSEFYDNGSNCETLLSCVTFTLYYGIRSGGGVGDKLDNASSNSPLYGWRHVFDLLFFIIVIIILLNIIFGIIIDTFGELRDKRKMIEEDVNNICIICGKEKYEFELRGSGWNEHIQLEHNLFSYLAYIIYIRRKPISECDGLEKYVKLKIKDGDVSFLPKNAMCLVKGEEDEQNNMLRDIDQGIKGIENLITKIEGSRDN